MFVNWEPEAVWRLGQRGRLSVKEHKNEKTYNNNLPAAFV
jgi:hypothetical protein